MAEREELYRRVPPPGDPIHINVEPTSVNNVTPGDVDMRERVMNLWNSWTKAASAIRAEHMKEWHCEMIREEEKGEEGKGVTWCIFVRLIQRIWHTGSIPHNCCPPP